MNATGSDSRPAFPAFTDQSCVSLVGMAGAGKTTLGKLLAARLDWAHLDTDRLIEAWWGQPLQTILAERGRDAFLACEEAAVAALGVKRCVVSTGGSAVYAQKAVERLRVLGPVVFLRIGLDAFLDRVGQVERRAFVMRPGMDLADVWRERQPLYEAAAHFTLETDRADPEQSADRLAHWLDGLRAASPHAPTLEHLPPAP